MSKTRPPYPAAFRQQMVELVRSGRTPGELAREVEPPSQAIRTWVAQAARDGGERSDGLRTEEREEIRRLRREVRRLREERDILTPPYMSRSVSGNSSSARHPSEPPSAKLPWLIAHTDDGRTSQPVPAAPPVSVRTDRGVTVSARGSDGRVQSAAPLSSFASDRDRFHSRVERDMPHGGGMVTLPVRDTRADDDPSSRGRPSHSSSRSHVQPLPCRFRARLPHYANDRRRSFAPLGLLLFRNRSEPTRVQFVGAQRRDHRQAASVQTAPDRWSWISAW